jgi:hypothetical protein
MIIIWIITIDRSIDVTSLLASGLLFFPPPLPEDFRPTYHMNPQFCVEFFSLLYVSMFAMYIWDHCLVCMQGHTYIYTTRVCVCGNARCTLTRVPIPSPNQLAFIGLDSQFEGVHDVEEYVKRKQLIYIKYKSFTLNFLGFFIPVFSVCSLVSNNGPT